MELIKKYRFALIGGAIGALAGLAYWYFVGCKDGTCAITSNPWRSSAYGFIMGILAGDGFKKEKKKTTEHGNPS
ncbi:MAG: DUF6132 family protein [Bacteroidetes bacterium]|nr:DUF6132 family protein [Bacteroidota bacterium]MCK6612133.1 DUF6132 family protein [Bacteroidia bacterium]